MGAALLSTPDLLCSILRALVKEVGDKHEIGISVKIRLLKTEHETRALVERLCQTGIIGLTVHCRTRNMRKTERAIRDQLRMIADTCRSAGVACLMNGDVESREQAEQLIEEYGVDGAMIATAAEKNPSVFRAKAEGGTAGWEEIVKGYMQEALVVENRYGNTKFLLAQMMPGKQQGAVGLGQAKNYADVCTKLGLKDLEVPARELDERLGIAQRESKSEQKAKSKARKLEQPRPSSNSYVQAASKRQKTESLNQQEMEKGACFTDLHADITAPILKT